MGDTKNPEILEIIKEFKIPFLKHPTQERVLQTPHMGQEQADLIQVETENMLKKGAIQQTEHQVGKFLSNVFLVGKRDEGNRPVVNLRYLNQFIPYQRQSGKFSLPPRITARERLHAQAGYERCLFFSSALTVIKEICSVFMVREFLLISLLMFRLGTSTQNHHKGLKIPVFVLRRINIRTVIYLDNMLIIRRSLEEIIMSRDTEIFQTWRNQI